MAMTKQAEREYALKVDQRHLFEKPYNDPRVFREFAMALELFRARLPGGSLLDMGCGPGWTSLLLARAGYDVLGVDISERMIEIAQERAVRENVRAEFQVGDMEDLDLLRHDFDGALYFDCLHHCPGFATALRRTFEHLRSGGYILLFETTLLHRYSRHARAVTRSYGVTELGFTRRQLRLALSAAGFTDIFFSHDPGPSYKGLSGFLKAGLRLWCDFFFYYPQAKNIVIARKP
jgi:SAM-dependent methyltransferase